VGLYELFIQPFAEFGFMRRALVACVALALGSAPMGTLLVLRRMSLMGDTMAHAVLPGAAIGFALAGFSLPAMGAGGLAAALLVALLAGWVAQVPMLLSLNSVFSLLNISLLRSASRNS